MYVDLYTAKFFVFNILYFIYDIIPDNQINTVNTLHFVSTFCLSLEKKELLNFSIPFINSKKIYGSDIELRQTPAVGSLKTVLRRTTIFLHHIILV